MTERAELKWAREQLPVVDERSNVVVVVRCYPTNSTTGEYWTKKWVEVESDEEAQRRVETVDVVATASTRNRRFGLHHLEMVEEDREI